MSEIINGANQPSNPRFEQFRLDLEDKTRILKQCHADHNASSCMPCESFFECEKRKAYVKAAFDKMCLGEDKGFIF